MVFFPLLACDINSVWNFYCLILSVCALLYDTSTYIFVGGKQVNIFSFYTFISTELLELLKNIETNVSVWHTTI